MRHLDNPGRQFGGIRLWGTIGWMAVGWLVSLAMGWTGANGTEGVAYEAFLIAMVLSIIVAIYCLTLPDTPPLARDRAVDGLAGLEEMLELLPKARCPGVSGDCVRRLPDHAHGLPGHARVPRVARLPRAMGADGDDPGTMARDRRPGSPDLDAGPDRLQRNTRGGHHRLAGSVPQPAGSATAGHRRRRWTVARSGGRLLHCGRTGFSGQPGFRPASEPAA